MRRDFLAGYLIIAATAAVLAVGIAHAQITAPTSPPFDPAALVLGQQELMGGDAAMSHEELPGLGHKFELLFGMDDSKDPLNVTNDVISVTTTAGVGGVIGVALRKLPPGIKITALENQLNLKYFFPLPPLGSGRTCAGGSPRIQLAIDTDGDGDFDRNAFGYVGHAPFGTGCLTGEWDIIDMTDQIGRWDASQLGGGMTLTWDMLEAFVTAVYPNHKVLSGSLVDDSGSFAPGAVGRAFYDLVTVENRTLENDQDTVRP